MYQGMYFLGLIKKYMLTTFTRIILASSLFTLLFACNNQSDNALDAQALAAKKLKSAFGK